MKAQNTVFQTGSSLVDSGAKIHVSQPEELRESDVTRVAEFFGVLRDRLQNELPNTAAQQMSEPFKRSLAERVERSRNMKSQ